MLEDLEQKLLVQEHTIGSKCSVYLVEVHSKKLSDYFLSIYPKFDTGLVLEVRLQRATI